MLALLILVGGYALLGAIRTEWIIVWQLYKFYGCGVQFTMTTLWYLLSGQQTVDNVCNDTLYMTFDEVAEIVVEFNRKQKRRYTQVLTGAIELVGPDFGVLHEIVNIIAMYEDRAEEYRRIIKYNGKLKEIIQNIRPFRAPYTPWALRSYLLGAPITTFKGFPRVDTAMQIAAYHTYPEELAWFFAKDVQLTWLHGVIQAYEDPRINGQPYDPEMTLLYPLLHEFPSTIAEPYSIPLHFPQSINRDRELFRRFIFRRCNTGSLQDTITTGLISREGFKWSISTFYERLKMQFNITPPPV